MTNPYPAYWPGTYGQAPPPPGQPTGEGGIGDVYPAVPVGGVVLTPSGGPEPLSGGQLAVTCTAAAAGAASAGPGPGESSAAVPLAVALTASGSSSGGGGGGGGFAHVMAISDVQVTTGGAWVTQANAVRDYIVAAGFDMIVNIGDETNADGAPPSGGSWPWFIPVWDSRKASVRPCHGSNTHVSLAHWQAYYSPRNMPYYWEIGGWRIVNVDSNSGASTMTSFINANVVTTQPTIVCWHEPAFSGGDRHPGGNASMRAVFAACVAKGVELVLNGHTHIYERYARMNGSGARDSANGTREIIVGTGGQANEAWTASSPGAVEAHFSGNAAGATELKLYKDRYEWFYKDVITGSGGAGSYTDSGSQSVRHPIP
jgi:hypothetical protein